MSTHEIKKASRSKQTLAGKDRKFVFCFVLPFSTCLTTSFQHYFLHFSGCFHLFNVFSTSLFTLINVFPSFFLTFFCRTRWKSHKFNGPGLSLLYLVLTFVLSFHRCIDFIFRSAFPPFPGTAVFPTFLSVRQLFLPLLVTLALPSAFRVSDRKHYTC